MEISQTQLPFNRNSQPPNLHYKRLIATFNKYRRPLLLLVALGYFSIIDKIPKDKEVQKTYLIHLIVTVATVALQIIIEQNKKPSAFN